MFDWYLTIFIHLFSSWRLKEGTNYLLSSQGFLLGYDKVKIPPKIWRFIIQNSISTLLAIILGLTYIIGVPSFMEILFFILYLLFYCLNTNKIEL